MRIGLGLSYGMSLNFLQLFLPVWPWGRHLIVTVKVGIKTPDGSYDYDEWFTIYRAPEKMSEEFLKIVEDSFGQLFQYRAHCRKGSILTSRLR